MATLQSWQMEQRRTKHKLTKRAMSQLERNAESRRGSLDLKVMIWLATSPSNSNLTSAATASSSTNSSSSTSGQVTRRSTYSAVEDILTRNDSWGSSMSELDNISTGGLPTRQEQQQEDCHQEHLQQQRHQHQHQHHPHKQQHDHHHRHNYDQRQQHEEQQWDPFSYLASQQPVCSSRTPSRDKTLDLIGAQQPAFSSKPLQSSRKQEHKQQQQPAQRHWDPFQRGSQHQHQQQLPRFVSKGEHNTLD